MYVIYWNRSKRNNSFKQVSLDKLFSNSDVIFNTIATAPELKGFLNKKLLSKFNSTAIVCSTSDTHVLDTDFIFKQIKNNKLGGYAFENTEQKITDFEGNVMVFPEQAYFTLGTLQNTARILTETTLSVINKKPINKVN
jgi:lactate dehydrogenase-like 2-hydroxyacid dehydrogenase